MKKKLFKYAVLSWFGGSSYVAVEILWRNYTVRAMFVLGAICFLMIGDMQKYIPWEMSFITQVLIGTAIVTAMEFVAGCILNLWLGLHIWDYSDMPFNAMGQICLLYVGLWALLVPWAILLDDCLRWKLFNEDSPHYRIGNIILTM